MYGVPSDEIDKIEFQYQRSRNEGKGNVRREARKRNWWHVLQMGHLEVSEMKSCEESKTVNKEVEQIRKSIFFSLSILIYRYIKVKCETLQPYRCLIMS